MVSYNEDREAVLAQLLEEIHQRLRAGEPIDLNDYARKYPAYIDELKRLLPTLAELGRASSSLNASSTSDGNTGRTTK
ncbi:MAG: hypothetical protein R6U98_34775 [Pirellulaceae bacterium]